MQFNNSKGENSEKLHFDECGTFNTSAKQTKNTFECHTTKS